MTMWMPDENMPTDRAVLMKEREKMIGLMGYRSYMDTAIIDWISQIEAALEKAP